MVTTPDPPQGESASRRSELAVTARPPEVAEDPARLRPNLPDVAGPNPPNTTRSDLPDATLGLGASEILGIEQALLSPGVFSLP